MTTTLRQNHTPAKANKSLFALTALGCLALLLFAYRKMGDDLWRAWQSDEYSHGIIIPFIALLIAWHRLTEKRPVISSSWWSVPVLAISGGLLFIAVLAAFPTAAQYGFVLALVALTLAFWGTAAARVMAPAFVYLIFAIPLPHLVYANLSQNLQLISSTLGVWLLDLIGLTVFQEGNVIDLGHYKLQVVEACSGLRYLFPLVSFGYLIAYLFEDRMWKRAVVFFSAIPITLGMNSLRITVIGITVNLWGSQMAEGLLHDFEGWVIFLLCTALLMGEVWVLMRIGHRGHFRFEIFAPAHGALVSGRAYFSAPIMAMAVLSALFAGVFGTGIIDERPEIIPTHPAFANFPFVLGKWHGQQHSLEPDILQGLQLSDYWLADYSADDDKAAVNFYIAYYDKQHVGSSTHTPSNCIPGGGWQIADKSVKMITLANGESIELTRLLIRKANTAQLVYYWFDERGRDITETYYAKWYLLTDAITMHRTDGALIRLVTPIVEGDSEAQADKRLNAFLSIARPEMKKFIPGSTLSPVESSSLSPLP